MESFEVLIDTGSTHNFMQEDLVQTMGCPTKDQPRFNVMVRDENYLKFSYTFLKVELDL